MKRIILLSCAVMLAVALSFMTVRPGGAAARSLEIYYVDVEGGAATLIVTPAGESILVDAGWPGFDGRDAGRIVRAMKTAGIEAIDHLITTHYHTDHYGGIPQLAERVRIRKFYDHGPMSKLDEDRDFAKKYAAYQNANKGRSITLKPGDSIKLRREAGSPPVSLLCLAARREVVASKSMAPVPNSICSTAEAKAEDPSDNAQSVVFLLRYGAFDFLDTGDLTWNIEQKLVCPRNMIGQVDLYQVGHHGLNSSNNPVVLRSIDPTVAIMNNGPRKGGHPDIVKWLRELPGLKDLYQVHRNVTTTDDQNTAAELIANLEEKEDSAHMIRVSVDAMNKRFTVTNDRNSLSRSYQIK
ncbi:MAG: MBL fold metallo-hydrolase [Acidobacteria bacterium]|nr:MBL fold metallo-hydrolase [Acidobacteriota bacterium]